MHLVMASPNRYIQESGILKETGKHITPLGNKVLLVGDKTTLAVVREDLTESLNNEDIKYKEEVFGGEVTKKEAKRIAKLTEDEGFEVIIGIGGGKAIDTAKAAAAFADYPFVAVPTIASNCAPWTPLSVFYNEEGEFEEYVIFQYSPTLVLVDTEIIAKSPINYFKAGIADTVVKWYEARASSAKKEKNIPTQAALNVAQQCAENLFKYGVQASYDLEKKRPTKAVEKTVDCIIALSGMVGGLGSDNCRIAAAHAVHNGFTVLDETHNMLHGEKVAYGNLVQLVLEDDKENFHKLMDFLKKLDQPITLKGLDLKEVTESDLRKVAKATCKPEESVHNMPFKITSDMVLDAIKKVDKSGQSLL
ncbi:iron-containing alcohol dehydrogenase family protein [Selenihalanaerobacter shriftii]|uniref:Glycerol dehydrogenase n=1 Tax=Selenihalanaerobacter shriftii TaxID=142842 RepID=A0A1T4MW06_9FIRM|nr:iron-containing alcohol dehydrogenase family protein [Selenihalanaerobacter shriftii]SJZ71143.1 glycerol dehydrogenase [Selenihalanaerobacter shriftii]